MKSGPLNWERLSSSCPDELLKALRRRVDGTEPFSTTPGEVAAEVGCGNEQAQNLLDELVAKDAIQVIELARCRHCGHDLEESQKEETECPYCNAPYGDNGLETYRRYFKEGQRTRDVKWVVTIHGMNTRGAWQEEYSWRLARVYGYSVPVAIYKYGNIKVSPFLFWRCSHYTRRLTENLRRYSTNRREDGYGDRPDVIAHSFGTWLLYRALKADSSLQVGRVILTGSIIPPDFDWKPLMDSGQVGAVLCHHAARDIVVRMAQYGICDAGPSGYCGFNGKETVIHKLEPTFEHSDFFSSKHLETVMEDVWRPFLTEPLEKLRTLFDPIPASRRQPWTRSRWVWITLPLTYLLLSALLLMCVFCVLSAVRGVPDTWRCLCNIWE